MTGFLACDAATDAVLPRRRKLLTLVPAAIVAGGLLSAGDAKAARREMVEKQREPKVTPPEDLMREHGVLDRVLLVYEAALGKFDAREDFDPAVLASAARIVRDFIENYHEESEEHAVFPRFKQAGKLVTLVDTLVAQHKAGRRLTEMILKTAPGSRKGREAARTAMIVASWSDQSAPSSRCTVRTPRVRTPISFRCSRPSSRQTNMMRWRRTLRRRSISSSAATVSR
ncbi:hemerythrin domain-containing protein [Bradyrhizobium sp. SSUT112]|uniref:hemerythrin domain-containing protein n=1 Tax=Bradyrhizobium sp. SSUT112 TaxID=3040604 RepID=UPI00244CB515|nr:hemerythrin domain-containing protein [Bradyrhizobium sp. SSUT112]MDH2357063.1 hemerythrin domain-containing protein [Bradyrhizobium sp. SSUT112]